MVDSVCNLLKFPFLTHSAVHNSMCHSFGINHVVAVDDCTRCAVNLQHNLGALHVLSRIVYERVQVSQV